MELSLLAIDRAVESFTNGITSYDISPVGGGAVFYWCDMRDASQDVTVSEFRQMYRRFASKSNAVYKWLKANGLSYNDGGTVLVRMPEADEYLAKKSSVSKKPVRKSAEIRRGERINDQRILKKSHQK